MLKVLSLEDRIAWDQIVNSFADADVYYLSGYVAACKVHGDGEPLLFYYESEFTRAINVVMQRDISLDKNFVNKIPTNTYFDFSTPYGYGGWIIEGKNAEDVFQEYEKWCISHNVVCEFVRYHPITKNHNNCSNRYEVIKVGQTISIPLTNIDDIWANFSKKNRNVIRKANANCVFIRSGSINEIDVFMDIYNKTMDKDNATDYYYFSPEYYKTLFELLGEDAKLIFAEKDNVPIAASIILRYKNKLNYHLSGSLEDYRLYAPTNLLLWEMCKNGVKNGCKTFHLGGGVGGSDDGLFHFKKSFYKGDPLGFFIGKKVFNKNLYNELVSYRSDISNTNYFPLYRG